MFGNAGTAGEPKTALTEVLWVEKKPTRKPKPGETLFKEGDCEGILDA